MTKILIFPLRILFALSTLKTMVLTFLFLSCSTWNQLNAFYNLIYSTTDHGAITFTGNTLGLNKWPGENNPGSAPAGSIGAFITTNTSLPAAGYAPHGPFVVVPNGTYPTATPGTTTLLWQQNSSSAVLDLPVGSTVLHAELVWSGSFGYNGQIPISVVDDPNSLVTFITPDGKSYLISKNPNTSQQTPGSTGYYMRSADVTAIVSMAGTYTVGGIPGTLAAANDSANAAGWTLAVVYQYSAALINNLTLFVCCEGAGSPASTVQGFCTPASGSLSPARLVVSAIEGDPGQPGDRMKFGPTTASLIPDSGTYVLSGPNNIYDNFFASQINKDDGTLDTRGTYGDYNAVPPSPGDGTRQGYDITNVDISNTLTYNQTIAYAQGTTTQEYYAINALGLQIPVTAPLISISESVNLTQAVLGDTLIYTVVITNTGTAEANNGKLTTVLSDGLTYIPNSSTPTAMPDLTLGIPIGTIPINGNVTVTFSATIDSYPQSVYDTIYYTGYDHYNNSTINYDYPSCTGSSPVTVNLSMTSNTVSTHLPGADIHTFKTSTPTNVAAGGQQVIYTITAENLGPDSADNVIISDKTPPETAYVSSSPPATGVAVGSSGILTFPPISLNVSDSVTYFVTVTAPSTPGTSFTNSVSSTSLTYDANQGNNDGSAPDANITLTVSLVAVPDTGTTPANTNLIVPNPGVLANDFGVGISVTSYTQPPHGSVVVSSLGGYTYTPNFNFSGIDSFDYTITDVNSTTSSTTVTITVTPTSLPQFITTDANTSISVPAGSGLLSGSAGTGLTITSYTQPSVPGSSVTVNPDGSYTYNPAFGFSGTGTEADTFTFTATDAIGQTTTNLVTVTVLPISNPDEGSTLENLPLNGDSVLDNDFGSYLSVTSYSTPTNGSVFVNSDGTYLYTPNMNYFGPDSFTYTATDFSGQTTTNTVTITVVQNAPYTNPNFGRTYVNTALVQTTSVFDNDSSGLSLYSYTQPSNGSVVVNADGTYVYTPNTSFTGIDFFTYIGINQSSIQTSPTKVLIIVQPVPFRLVPDTAATRVNIPLNGISVLRNDIGANLQVTSHTQPLHGLVVMNSNGKYVFVPQRNFSGIVKFNYTATDAYSQTGTSSVTINIQPKAFNNTGTTPANTPLNGNIVTNDLGTGLQVTHYAQPFHGTVFISPNGFYTYIPANGYSGPDSFMYTITDSSAQSSTATVNISVTPYAANFSITTSMNTPVNGSILNNDIGSDLMLTGYTQPSHGVVVINVDGTFTYTPIIGYAGPDSFSYTITDSTGQTSEATVFITVTPVPPPINFTGVIKKCLFLNRTNYRLEMQWNAAPASDIAFYRIYSRGQIVTEVSAGGALTATACLKNKKSAYGYQIAAVNQYNAESTHIEVRIIYE